jgi:hypothetical protein
VSVCIVLSYSSTKTRSEFFARHAARMCHSEQRTNKQRCDLCMMWFDTASVDCIVPRKRLLDLQASCTCIEIAETCA